MPLKSKIKGIILVIMNKYFQLSEATHCHNLLNSSEFNYYIPYENTRKVPRIFTLNKFLGLFLLIILFLTNPLSTPKVTGGRYLTLDESISLALSQNNLLRSSQFAQKKAEWNKRQAWSLLFPTLSFNSRLTRIDDQTLAERDIRRYLPPELADQMPQTVFHESYYTSLDVSLPLFNGALLNGLSIAGANQKMAEQMSESTRDNLIFLVISSYLNVLKGKDILKLQQDYLELTRLNYEKAERLHEAGRYSKVEALRWKVEYQQQKSVVVGSESALRSAMTVLIRLLNLNMLENIEIEEHIPQRLLIESEQLIRLSDDEILKLIQLENEALIQANAELSAAKSNEKISRLLYHNAYTSYLPNISLNYSYAWRENNTVALDDYSPKTVMINFNLPLFSGFQNYTALKSACYDYKQSREQFADRLQNSRFILTETANKLINLKTQQELSKANVEFNEHNYRIVEQQKEQGLVSNIDFIDAKLNLQNAKFNDISNHYDFISAMVELYYLLGQLDSIIE